MLPIDTAKTLCIAAELYRILYKILGNKNR